jgi:hypothetical protein
MAYKGCERITGKPNVHIYHDYSATPAYKAGELVSLDTNGKLLLGAAGDATATAGIIGIAMIDSPSSTTTDVPVDVITSDGSTFIMKTTDTSSEANNGNQLAISFVTTAQTCAVSNSNESAVQLGLWDAAGATKARIIVGFLNKVLQSEIGW